MRATIDGAGRILIPKPLRDQLGFVTGTELELTSVDGRLEVAVASRVTVEQGLHGVRLTVDTDAPLTAAQVRSITDRGRR